jgi:hypothetical protein
MEVERVNTRNYRGKKKRHVGEKGQVTYYRRSDWKKAYVVFKPPQDVLEKWQAEQAEKKAKQLHHEASERQEKFRRWRQRHPHLFSQPPAATQQQQQLEQNEQQQQQQQEQTKQQQQQQASSAEQKEGKHGHT